MSIVSYLSFFLSFLYISRVSAISCIDNSGSAIPWFFLLKYPRKTQTISGEDNKYAYFDSSFSSQDFELRSNFIDSEGEALFTTLTQINKQPNLQVIAWNDEPADGSDAPSEHTAHSKGVIIYDSRENNAIYVAHSIPKYPEFESNGKIKALIPSGERKYGQNVLCMSLDGENIEKVAKGLSIIGSVIYHNTFSSKELANLYGFSKESPSSVKNFAQQSHEVFSVGKVAFQGFFKNPYYEEGLIFEEIMQPVLKTSLLVESWGRPYKKSSCDSQFSCVNIQEIQIQDDPLGNWTDEDDHSKWVISQGSKNVVCSGDMNHMTSQAKRGGAFFCFEGKGLWKALNSAVKKAEVCERNYAFLA